MTSMHHEIINIDLKHVDTCKDHLPSKTRVKNKENIQCAEHTVKRKITVKDKTKYTKLKMKKTEFEKKKKQIP